MVLKWSTTLNNVDRWSIATCDTMWVCSFMDCFLQSAWKKQIYVLRKNVFQHKLKHFQTFIHLYCPVINASYQDDLLTNNLDLWKTVDMTLNWYIKHTTVFITLIVWSYTKWWLNCHWIWHRYITTFTWTLLNNY